MAAPLLWHFTVSHFNEKARWALDFKHIPHVRRALFFSYLPRTLWRTRQPSLPVLILDGIADSTRIIAALEQLQPDGFSVADLTAAALFYPLVQPPESP